MRNVHYFTGQSMSLHFRMLFVFFCWQVRGPQSSWEEWWVVAAWPLPGPDHQPSGDGRCDGPLLPLLSLDNCSNCSDTGGDNTAVAAAGRVLQQLTRKWWLQQLRDNWEDEALQHCSTAALIGTINCRQLNCVSPQLWHVTSSSSVIWLEPS